jgi:CheY-like chemotaxis protein
MTNSKGSRVKKQQQQLVVNYYSSYIARQSYDGSRFALSDIGFASISGKDSFAAKDSSNTNREAQKNKIMIVDDESQIAKLYSLILSNAGFTVSHLEFDGSNALSRLQNGADIELMIIDQRMPNMDGTTATKMIKGIRPNLKVIMVSAYEIPEADKSIFEAVLTKPVSSKALVDTVTAILG